MSETKDKKQSVGPHLGPLNFGPGSYLESTSRPLYALLFLIPWLAVYEFGTLFVNTDAIAHVQARVAAFTWLMGLAEWIGVHRSLAWAFPGFVVVVILFCWHMSSQYPWSIKPSWLLWMLLEAAMLTLPLFVLSALAEGIANGGQACVASGACEHSIDHDPYIAQLVTSIGAGIYEELVFPLIVVGVVIMFLEDVVKIKGVGTSIIAVLISAGLFAAHYYVGIEDGQLCKLQEHDFTLGGFLFRAAAGVYFAVIFRYRGYGITAGTHAAYNMILFTFS